MREVEKNHDGLNMDKENGGKEEKLSGANESAPAPSPARHSPYCAQPEQHEKHPMKLAYEDGARPSWA